MTLGIFLAVQQVLREVHARELFMAHFVNQLKKD